VEHRRGERPAILEHVVMNKLDPHPWARAYPELGEGPLSIEPYVSPAWFEAEKEKIFKRLWLCVGRVEEVAKPGDYKIKRIHVADTSAIIIRGKDDRVRAFHNVCSHRCNTVLNEEGDETYGHCGGAVMTCRFHRWSYAGDGRLIGVPHDRGFYDGFSKADNGLAEIHCDLWEGFVFICLAEQPPMPLADFLGDYGRYFAGFPYAEMSLGFKYETYLNCNWKVALDAFQETYHVPFIHNSFPHTVPSGPRNFQTFGLHRSCGIALDFTGEPSPVSQLANTVRASLVAQKEGAMLSSAMNPDRDPNYSFELSCCFPNMLLHVAEGIWFSNTFWPVAHDKCFWEGRYHCQPPRTNSERWAIEHSVTLQRNTWLEDTATMENTQRAMMSGAKKIQNLQDDEVLLRHSYQTIADYVHG
jgi:phenylpropionate dioxygenase-like ring-hydroxylating dioxygenase large terminal subunit